MNQRRRGRRRVLPGFGLTMGYTATWLGLIVLVPVAALTLQALSGGWSGVARTLQSPRVVASFELTFGAALIGATVNAVFGMIVAWVLARYRFFGKRLVDALVDLPFAMPTAVAGIALTTLYAPKGWLGKPLHALGIKVAYAPAGIMVALTFVGLPFVVRTLQPVIESLDPEMEEAAGNLGASRWTTFAKVLFPPLVPAWLTGFALAFARAVGEYGSVIFIAGNMPMRTEIAPLLIMTRLEQYDYLGATAIAAFMLLISVMLLVTINGLQAWSSRLASAE